MSIRSVEVVDSHTGGEPTRVVVSGGPDLGSGSMRERLARFRDKHDDFRMAVVNEPRGSDVMVGALLCEPDDLELTAGVIFFNNVGYLGMCGHGTIGLMATLKHLGRVSIGAHRIETPAGVVTATLRDEHMVTVQNVPSYRLAADIRLDVPEYGAVHGDIAWGGNWFFLIRNHEQELTLRNLEGLTAFTWAVRRELERKGIKGACGAEIDHVELFGLSSLPGVHSKNFVLCPGKAYDRSPCGTGTSAKLACLYADGKLQPGEVWKQESIIGSVFEGTFEVAGGKVIPSITGSAFVTAEAKLLLDPADPFCMGIPA